MTYENDPNRLRDPIRDNIATGTRGYGWMPIAIVAALILGIIMLLPTSDDGTAPRVTEQSPRIDRPNTVPTPAPAPPANAPAPTTPPSTPTPPQ